MKKFISHIAIIWLPAMAFAQTKPDTSLTIISTENINILDQLNVFNPKFNVGTKTDTCSKFNHLIFSGRFLSDILSSFGNSYLKQTAPGQLATISLNGGNASQTQVSWQGINLNNPATGQSDFSLVPVALFSEISVLNGSTGAAGGSGSVTGTVLLKDNTTTSINEWNSSAGIHYGSFGRFSSNAGFSFNKNNMQLNVHLFYVNYKNNYSYKKTNDSTAALKNANVKAFGGITTLEIKTKKGNWSTSGWFQQNKRQIPPTLSQEQSMAKQDDALTRIICSYTPNKNIPFLNLNFAYLSDAINYFNGFTTDTSFTKLHTITAESKTQFVFRHVTNLAKITASGFFGQNNGYIKNELMTRIGISYFLQEDVELFTRVLYQWSLSFREEINQKELSIPIVQGGIELKINSKSTKKRPSYTALRLNGGTIYRFPTMNDLFWFPGGNPDLKSERGLSANAGITQHLAKEKMFEASIELNHFERYMFNMIVWQPRNGYWTPQNILQVWSRGNQTRLYVSAFEKIKLSVDASLNYTVSTAQKTGLSDDASVGKQMLYVPMYTSRVESGISYKQMKLSYIYSYTGYRYISADNYDYLKPFQTHDVRLAFFFEKKYHHINLYVEGANLTNTQYQWVASRPAMPRNFNAGIQVKFGNKFKSVPTNSIQEILIDKNL